MGYLLSKPNDWEVRMEDLDNQGPAGSRKLRRMLAELRACGYMNRIRTKLPDGKFEWTTEVYESPSQNPNPTKGVIKTSGAKCTSANPTSAKRADILSTESLSTESLIIKERLDLFKGYFGKFLSQKELERWDTLYEATGKERAEELAQWAFKKEIHMMNRAGLLDSLETAAKNWREKPAKTNGDAKQSKVDAAIAAFLAKHQEAQPHV